MQQGDSAIFVGSQPSAVGMQSTRWIETYAVAEAKFFRHISRQTPTGQVTLQCLQILRGCLTGVGFFSYTLKTIVMQLLSTVPLTQWCRKDFEQRLIDILMSCLREIDCASMSWAMRGFLWRSVCPLTCSWLKH